MVEELEIINKDQESLQEVKYVPKSDVGVDKYTPENKNIHKSDTLFLYFTIYTGLLPLVAGGANMVWLSSAYTSLISNNSYINPLDKPATTTEISLIGGLPVLFGLVGALVLTKLSNKIGRKWFLQVVALGMFFCNIGHTICTVAIQMIIMRCGLYFFLSAYGVIIQVYMSEVCEIHNKAKYFCVMGVCLPLGNIYAYYFGPIFHFKLYTNLLVVPLLPFLIFFCFVPESPVYLLSRNKNEECLKALMALRNNKSHEEIRKDLDLINENLKAAKSSGDKSILHLFKTPQARIGILLATMLGIGQHVSGMSVISTYLGPLLLEADTHFSENTMTVTVAVVQVVSILATSLVVEKVKRNNLLLLSCVGCGVPCLLWGFFYYLKHINSALVVSVQWLPLLFVIVYTIMYSVGLGPIPMAIICELFPSDLISPAITFTICVIGLTASIVVGAYPLITAAYGIHWCIWIFSLSSFVVGLFIYIFLPDTKGKSVIEIQEILKKY